MLQYEKPWSRQRSRISPNLTFSEIEFQRPGPHFAVDTVREFQLSYPDAQIYYLLGGDSLNDLPIWHDPTGFIRECDRIIVMLRRNEEPDWKSLDQKLPEFGPENGFAENTHYRDFFL